MFVYSLKASKFKVVFSVVICAVIAAAVIMLMPDTEHSVSVNGVQYDKKISFDGIKSDEDLVKFAENLGYSVDAEPIESEQVKLPSKFDAVMEKYNAVNVWTRPHSVSKPFPRFSVQISFPCFPPRHPSRVFLL